MSRPRAALEASWEGFSGETSCVVGIGIDLVEVRLVDELIRSGGQVFIDSVWTDLERRESEESVERLAARWAAKEAVMKVLGTGLGEIEPLDVEVAARASGAPRVVLRGAAAHESRQRGAVDWHVSMTHEGGWAAAIATASKHSHLGPEGGVGGEETA